MRRIAMCLLVGTALCLSARADVIELRTGQKIEGEVLKEAGGELVVDIGVDIIRVPTSQVKTRTSTEKKPEGTATGEADQFYLTADLPARSVKELSQTYGE